MRAPRVLTKGSHSIFFCPVVQLVLPLFELGGKGNPKPHTTEMLCDLQSKKKKQLLESVKSCAGAPPFELFSEGMRFLPHF